MAADYLEETVESLRRYAFTNLPLAELSNEALKGKLEELVRERLRGQDFSVGERADVAARVFHAIRGLGFLDEILEDSSITEIMINGPKNIFIERNGAVSRLDAAFDSEEQLRDVIQRIVDRAGDTINDADPIADTRLQDGSRVSIVIPPISLVGSVVTIRKFSKSPMSMDWLLRHGALTPEVAAVLEKLVRARYNIFVSGGTGSGKTTFLNALSNFIPKDERIITIEDTAELKITGIENLVSLESRSANSSASGSISIRDLIKASLRMRPERIIVGEVRGEEALDMLQAMNTGHDGPLSTGHANSPQGMLSRLETMVLQGSADVPLPAVRRQISSALDVIVHLSRLRDHSRKVMAVTEVLEDLKDGEVQLNPLYVFEEDAQTRPDKVSGRLVRTASPLYHTEKLLRAGYSGTL